MTHVDLYDKPQILFFQCINRDVHPKTETPFIGMCSKLGSKRDPNKKIAVDLHQQLGVVEEMLEGQLMVAERFR